MASLDINKSGRIGVHAMIYYIVTTTIAVLVGITLVSVIRPGNTEFAQTEGRILKEVSTLDTYLDLIRYRIEWIDYIGLLAMRLSQVTLATI